MRFTRITIIRSTRPEKTDINKELQWFGGTLGLFNLRDKDKSCFRIFITLLKALKEDQKLTSDEIAMRTKITRGTVVHHLHKLMGSGLVVHTGKRYMLRVHNLSELIAEIEHDLIRTMSKLRESAKEIDGRLNL